MSKKNQKVRKQVSHLIRNRNTQVLIQNKIDFRISNQTHIFEIKRANSTKR